MLTEELQVNKAKAKALIANAKDVSFLPYGLASIVITELLNALFVLDRLLPTK